MSRVRSPSPAPRNQQLAKPRLSDLLQFAPLSYSQRFFGSSLGRYGHDPAPLIVGKNPGRWPTEPLRRDRRTSLTAGRPSLVVRHCRVDDLKQTPGPCVLRTLKGLPPRYEMAG